MEMVIYNKSGALDSLINTYVRRTFRLALDRFATRIGSVRVTIDDVNGPRGGRDKECRVNIRLRSGELLLSKSLGTCAFETISLAADRCKRQMAKARSKARKRWWNKSRSELVD